MIINKYSQKYLSIDNKYKTYLVNVHVSKYKRIQQGHLSKLSCIQVNNYQYLFILGFNETFLIYLSPLPRIK